MILYFGNKLSRWGGSLSVIETLTPLLAKDFSIKSYSDKRNQIARLLEMGYRLLRYRKDVTLVLIDSYSTLAFWYTIILVCVCRGLRIPYIPIVHGGNFPYRLEHAPKLSNFVFKKADLIISPSLYLQDAFSQHGFAPIIYIPNSIQLEEFPFQQRSNLAPNLLWVRSFHKIYNPSMAIEVLRILKEKYPSAKLCMVGSVKDNSWDQVKEKVKEYNLEDAVKFTGSLSRSNWVKLSCEYDIFINTTNYDNMPISLLEALALGFPIVTTNPGGITFLFEDKKNALLVNVNDAEGMTQRIDQLLQDELVVDQLVINGKTKILEFSWKEVKSKWHSVLAKYEVPK